MDDEAGQPGQTELEKAPETGSHGQHKPNVGRIVHYTPPGAGNGKGQPYPAVITHVVSHECVNLAVAQDGQFKLDDLTPVNVNKGMGPGTWAWPARV